MSKAQLWTLYLVLVVIGGSRWLAAPGTPPAVVDKYNALVLGVTRALGIAPRASDDFGKLLEPALDFLLDVLAHEPKSSTDGS